MAKIECEVSMTDTDVFAELIDIVVFAAERDLKVFNRLNVFMEKYGYEFKKDTDQQLKLEESKSEDKSKL